MTSLIITGDGKWISNDNIIRKRSSTLTRSESKHPWGKILCVWLDCLGIIHHELLKSHLTICSDIYIQQLLRVNEKLHEKRSSLFSCPNVIRPDSSARSHIESVTQKTILRLQRFLLPDPPYSPDLAPTYYQLFCSLQNFLNGKVFKSEQVSQTVEEFLEYKPTSLYTDGIHKRPEGWEKVIKNNSEYIIN